MLTTAKFTTADELANHMLAMTGARAFQVRDTATSFRCATQHASQDGLLAVKQVIGADATLIADPACDAIVFHHLLSGRCEIASEMGHLAGVAGSGHVFTTRERITLRSSPTALRVGLMADRAALQSTLMDHFEVRCRTELTFSAHFDSFSPLGSYLKSATECLIHAAALQSNLPKATAALADNLLLILIEGFPHNYSELLTEKPPDLLPRHVKRAIAIMEEHAGNNLSVLALAELMSVSVRALQYAFLQHTGMSPMRYMHNIRLRRAVEDLATRPDLSPRQIAGIWGFTNFGRFSAACFRTYGKRPREIVKDGLRRR